MSPCKLHILLRIFTSSTSSGHTSSTVWRFAWLHDVPAAEESQKYIKTRAMTQLTPTIVDISRDIWS